MNEPYQLSTNMKHPMAMSREEYVKQLQNDSEHLAIHARHFFETVYPSYSVTDDDAIKSLDFNTIEGLKAFRFFKVISCMTEAQDDIAALFHKNMTRLMTAAYSMQAKICFGIIGREHETTLLIGIDPTRQRLAQDADCQGMIQGALPGISLVPTKFSSPSRQSWWGMMQAIPSVKIEDEPQYVDYSSMIRCLQGKEYNFFIVAQPVPQQKIQQDISTLLNIQSECSTMLKRNYSFQDSLADSSGRTDAHTTGNGWSANGGGLGALAGLAVALSPLPVGKDPVTMGICVGVGAAIGSMYSFSKNKSDSVSTTVNQTITKTCGENFDAQNFFAKELMEYIDASVERLRKSLCSGCWETLITYSARDAATLNLIQGSVYGDIAKPNKLLFPPRVQRLNYSQLQSLYAVASIDNCAAIFPKSMFWKNDDNDDYRENKISAPLTSQELALLTALPDKSAPGFEVRRGKIFSFSADGRLSDIQKRLGVACEGEQIIEHELFGLDNDALNKHTFVCGITGCGKTNTVKKILEVANVPFLVIECAKKEYRHMGDIVEKKNVLTPGRTELHCPRFNPFYIQSGISLQTHIDYLKDLFNASFAFYGPMTYILETCIHRVYQQKGWNLTTGDHPLLVKSDSFDDRYNGDFIRSRYQAYEHRFLFPTMNDLLKEVNHYIETELNYDAEVSGNIRSAMKTRLENLCLGSKGFMFDTDAPVNMAELLSENIVLELDGLADDSDKAFVVGLLIILISEFRMSNSEENQGILKHLLVIEEAHRLLKNVSTERSSENMGNPKGKAVEHFTNILAEMRSYGQGVVIAEQIPSKIAPDVIKNSSNKIVHRLVSKDDQEFLANAIGMAQDDAILMGTLRPGYAFCHKEGMYTPVIVKVDKINPSLRRDEDIRIAAKDATIIPLIEHQMAKCFSISDDTEILKFLDSLMYVVLRYKQSKGKKRQTDELKDSFDIIRQDMIKAFYAYVMQGVETHKVSGEKGQQEIAFCHIVAKKMTMLFCNGVYAKASKIELPTGLCAIFFEALQSPEGICKDSKSNNFDTLITTLCQLDPYADRVYRIVENLAIDAYFKQKDKKENVDRRALIRSFFLLPYETCISEISRRICKMYSIAEVK